MEETNSCVELWLNRILNHCHNQLGLKNSIQWQWAMRHWLMPTLNNTHLVTNRYSFSATRSLRTSIKWHLCYNNSQRLNSGTHSHLKKLTMHGSYFATFICTNLFHINVINSGLFNNRIINFLYHSYLKEMLESSTYTRWIFLFFFSFKILNADLVWSLKFQNSCKKGMNLSIYAFIYI